MQSGNSVYKDGVLSVAVLAVFDSLFPKRKQTRPFFFSEPLTSASQNKKTNKQIKLGFSIYKQFYIKPGFLSFLVIT